MANYVPSNLSGDGAIISTAVAVDRDKNSQHAVKWAIDNLKLKDNWIILVHVSTQHNQDVFNEGRSPTPAEMQKVYLPYRGFCARKGIRAKEVILHDLDIASALCEYIRLNSLTTIVLGSSSRSAIARAFKNTDVPTAVGASAPDFCSVYVVSKGKALKIKSANESVVGPKPIAHNAFSIDNQSSTKFHPKGSWRSSPPEQWDGSRNSSPLNSISNSRDYHIAPRERTYNSNLPSPQNSDNSNELPWEYRHGSKTPTLPESAKTSFESLAFGSNYTSPHNSGFGDSEFGRMIMQNRHPDGKIFALPQTSSNLNLRIGSASGSSDNSGEPSFQSDVSFEHFDQSQISDSSRSSASSQAPEIEDELRRLKLELTQITEMYNLACREAVTARDEVKGINQWKSDEGTKLEDAINAQEAALAIVERERQKYKFAIEVGHKAQRIAELESEKRKRAEIKYKNEAGEKQKAIDALTHCVVRYRKYSIGEIEIATDYFSDSNKIGEGGYGPVYKATLDHTPVAIKVLRSNISQGQKQFQREVEVLSRMRHPHMVILLGACPEYGCLVYEHMENGSLEDRLFCKDRTAPLPWGSRFRISTEIATALNFLHQTRPEPLVHRDLKPGNILLDKNYVSKISDVGLARLVPPSVADNVTQYCMTAAAGTFCYIDPEYQQTGMLGVKSDIYSLGVMLLQIITAKAPMGLAHHVQSAIDTGRFTEILDPVVNDWPVEEALCYAKLALKCCELRRKDRPDLDTVILPELERLRDLDSQSKLEARYDHMYGQSNYQGSSPLSQESRDGNSGTPHGNNGSKYGSGTGSSTLTTSESMD